MVRARKRERGTGAAERRGRPADPTAELPAGLMLCYGTRVAKRLADGRLINIEAAGADGAVCLRVDDATVLQRYRDRGQLDARSRDNNERLYEAGRRLHQDWTIAGREPPVTARYSERIGGPGANPGGIQEAARERYVAVLRAVGAQLSPVLVHVALLDQPVTDWARSRGWVPQVGMPLLQLALDALADHYRLRRP
jgi:hypothetical protein